MGGLLTWLGEIPFLGVSGQRSSIKGEGVPPNSTRFFVLGFSKPFLMRKWIGNRHQMSQIFLGQGFHNEEAGFLIDEGVIVVSLNYRQATLYLFLLFFLSFHWYQHCFPLWKAYFSPISCYCCWNNSRLNFMGFLSLDIQQASGNQVSLVIHDLDYQRNNYPACALRALTERQSRTYDVNCKYDQHRSG